MEVLGALGETIVKMFAADFALTVGALAAVAVCAVALRGHWIGPGALPFLLAAGVLASLAVGVWRGARR
ncbi:MAG: hypothetical protein ACYC8V_08475 [Caulobacteraceae bacterium]